MPPWPRTRMPGSEDSALRAGGKRRWPRYAIWISPTCWNQVPRDRLRRLIEDAAVEKRPGQPEILGACPCGDEQRGDSGEALRIAMVTGGLASPLPGAHA